MGHATEKLDLQLELHVADVSELFLDPLLAENSVCIGSTTLFSLATANDLFNIAKFPVKCTVKAAVLPPSGSIE